MLFYEQRKWKNNATPFSKKAKSASEAKKYGQIGPYNIDNCILLILIEILHFFVRSWCVGIELAAQVFNLHNKYTLNDFIYHIQNCFKVKDFKITTYPASKVCSIGINGDVARLMMSKYKNIIKCSTCQLNLEDEIYYDDLLKLFTLLHDFWSLVKNYSGKKWLNTFIIMQKYIIPMRLLIIRLAKKEKQTR